MTDPTETEKLIARLAGQAPVGGGRAGAAVAPDPARGLAIMLAVGLAAATALVTAFGAIRPDLSSHVDAACMKALYSSMFALLAGGALTALAQPGRMPARRLVQAAIAGGAVLALALAYAATRPDQVAAALGAGGRPVLLIYIPLLALPTGALLFIWCRRQAPTRPALAGFAAGGLAGGVAAMVYALVCPVDQALFVAAWYGAAVAICAVVGAVAGRWILRW
jgi:hypothetical protein